MILLVSGPSMDSTRIRSKLFKSPSFTKVLEVYRIIPNFSPELFLFFHYKKKNNLEATTTAIKLGMFIVPTHASALIVVVCHDLLPMTNSNPEVSGPSRKQGIFQTFYMLVTAENLRLF